MKIRSKDEYHIREIEIMSNDKDTVFLAFTEAGHSLDDYRYYTRDLTYDEAKQLIDGIKQVMNVEGIES